MKIFLAVLFLAVPAMACPTGTVEWERGCAAIPAPKDTVAVPEVKPSTEKPPQDKMPSYQREGIHADMPNSVAGADDIADRQKADAVIEGKKKAGIK